VTGIGPWVRRSRRVAYQNPWITVWHDDVTQPDGQPGLYGVVHFEGRSVGVVAIDDQDRVAMVRQHRYTLDLPSWEIPEGSATAGESLLVGAQRELVEETGLSAGSWRELARIHTSNSVTDELAVLFVATDLAQGEARLDGTETDMLLAWFPFEEAIDMIEDGRITDAMSVVALQRLALERRSRVERPGENATVRNRP
jgi:8-oxo-dGTP pyrophosphatase MutT (NUDIX family)